MGSRWLRACLRACLPGALGCLLLGALWSTAWAAPARAAEFGRGVNLARWLEAAGGPPVSAQELRALRQAGFDHVRLPVDPVALGWNPAQGLRAAPGQRDEALPPALARSGRLRAAIDAALGAGLDVIVDLHPDAATREAIERDAATAEAYLALWKALAAALADTPYQRVALELLNEPQYYGLAGNFLWNRYQRRLVAAVRPLAPRHTLVVSGRKGGSLEGLLELEPLQDSNLIYSFHYYLPYVFTHQGAAWMRGDEYTTAGHWREVRYPAAQARVRLPHTDGGAHRERAAGEMAEYFRQDWNRARIAAQWRPLAQWARAHRLRVHLGEFGVMREGVDPASRYAWIGDVRALAQAQGWGWSLWNYGDDFGIAADSNVAGRPPGALEPAALEALGLRRAARPQAPRASGRAR